MVLSQLASGILIKAGKKTKLKQFHFQSEKKNFNMVIREAPLSEKCSFFEHCSIGLWPPPLLIEHLSYFVGGVF